MGNVEHCQKFVAYPEKRVMLLGVDTGIDFATRVRLTRVLLNWRQSRLAGAMGFLLDTVSAWETGSREPRPLVKRLLVILAEREDIQFDKAGYPSFKEALPPA